MIFVGYDKDYKRQYYNCLKTIEGETCPTPYLNRKGSTAFTFSRFLIPHETNYSGWHIFCDSDFLFLNDINKIYQYCDDKYAVMVVKHKPYNVHNIKMDKKNNSYYDRKNWASLILWNSNHPSNKILTKEYVENSNNLDLLQFTWLNDNEIGELPAQWNVLVDHQKEENANALHFTNGIETQHYEELLSEMGIKV